MKYFTNGAMDDPSGSGLTIAAFQTDADGNVPKGQYLGYLAKEITKEEYEKWLSIISAPDNVNYFNGAFIGVGVVDAKTHKENEDKVAESQANYNKKVAEENAINFKLAQRDAEAIGEDHEAVFTSKHPTVSEDVKAMLFAEARKAKG